MRRRQGERERDDDHDCVGEGPCEEEEEQVEDSKFNAYCKACIQPGRETQRKRQSDAAHVYY